MLPEEKRGVVDAQLRVNGTRSFHVVETSAIPLISTVNLQYTVYAFTKRAADFSQDIPPFKALAVI